MTQIARVVCSSSSCRMRHLWLLVGLVTALVATNAHRAAWADAAFEIATPADEASAAIEQGLQLEQEELWTDAISH
jgi:hypothetical protein